MTKRTKYNNYDDDFKATAVALIEIPGIKTTDVAKLSQYMKSCFTVGVWECDEVRL